MGTIMILHVMTFCLNTKDSAVMIKLQGKWNGKVAVTNCIQDMLYIRNIRINGIKNKIAHKIVTGQ
jgi:hypothetical protein